MASITASGGIAEDEDEITPSRPAHSFSCCCAPLLVNDPTRLSNPARIRLLRDSIATAVAVAAAGSSTAADVSVRGLEVAGITASPSEDCIGLARRLEGGGAAAALSAAGSVSPPFESCRSPAASQVDRESLSTSMHSPPAARAAAEVPPEAVRAYLDGRVAGSGNSMRTRIRCKFAAAPAGAAPAAP